MGKYQTDASSNFKLSSEAKNTMGKDSPKFVWTSVSTQYAHFEKSINEETR